MDKNSLIGFSLIAVVLIGFSYFSQPSEKEIALRQQQDSIRAIQSQQEEAIRQAKAATTESKEKMVSADTTALFYEATAGTNKKIILQNNVVKLTFDTKGGRIAEAQLKDYKNQQKEPVTLFTAEDADMTITFAGNKENICSTNYYFTPVNCTDSTVTMQLQGMNGAILSFEYKLIKDSYMVDFTISSKGLAGYLAPNSKKVTIDWRDKAKQQEKGYKFENQYSTLTYKKHDGGTDYLAAHELKEEKIGEQLDWIAFKNQFFSCVFISYDNFSQANLRSEPLAEGSGYLKQYNATMETSFDPSGAKPTQMQFYFGPNKYRLLQSMNDYNLGKDNLDLEELVYLGWPLFRWINRFFTIYVFDWLTQLGFPMGIVLLLITILLKIIVYPTTRKSYLSSAKMRVLKPKMDEIGKKYPNKEDAMKKQQEIMGMYSRYGVSPMGGCMPMLLQMPIWIAMFNFVPNAIELRQQSFLWASDLSTYDSIISWDKPIWLIGNHLSLFCILFCASNLVYSWMTMKQQKESMVGEQAEQMKIMQYMMLFMPLFFFFIFNDYSAGLNYYYFISLLLSALTMWYLRKTTDDEKLLAKLEENYKINKDNPKKMGGLAARLGDLQKRQAEMMEMQKKRNQKK